MKRVNDLLLLTAVIGLTGALPQSTTAPTDAYKVKETRLGPIDAEMLFPVFSRDARHLAYVTHRGQRFCVATDGQAGEEYVPGSAGRGRSRDTLRESI